MSFRPLIAAARTLLSALALFMAGTQAVYAYIDPGTGSMIIQLLAAAVAGSLFYVRRWREFISSWFLRRKSDRTETGTGSEREAD